MANSSWRPTRLWCLVEQSDALRADESQQCFHDRADADVWPEQPGYQLRGPTPAATGGRSSRLHCWTWDEADLLQGRTALRVVHVGVHQPDGAGDAPVWAEVQPQLSTQATHSPQWVNGGLIAQASTFLFIAGAYSYNPVLIGTDEGDMMLTFNLTKPTPGFTANSLIIWTGRKATDAPNTMGQDAGTFSFTYFGYSGDGYVASSHWSDYAACAVPLNSVTRGKVWCIGATAGDSNLLPGPRSSTSCVWSSAPGACERTRARR